MAKKQINLALQGGGAHGAFTWGVLDRLLEEDGIEIAAISGTSAGALNGAAVKAGMLMGGAEAARDNLEWLWEQMGVISGNGFWDWIAGLAPGSSTLSKLVEMSPAYQFADAASRMLSPYAMGPAYKNPIERIARRFRYDKVCAAEGPRFFVCATNVRNGRIRVFTGEEINTRVLMASTCLPTVFQAVEMKDPKTGKMEAFWDGGYTGNPALWPLYAPDLPDDVVVVNINPLTREEVPKTAPEIQNRINEISFNAALLGELRAIAFVKRLIREGHIKEGQMKNVLIHMIHDDALMSELSIATKLVPVPALLSRLKEHGRATAEVFLRDHIDDLNQRGTLDLAAMFG